MGLSELIFLGIGALIVFFIVKSLRSNSADGEDEFICKHCGHDLRAARDRCPGCGRAFHRDAPASKGGGMRVPKPDEVPVLIHTTEIAAQAHALQSHLQRRGVRSRVVDRPILASADNTQVLGAWRVMVWSGDQDRALQIRHQLIPQQTDSASAGQTTDRA